TGPFLTGHRHPDGAGDVVWFTAAGAEMTEGDWKSGFARSLAVLIDDPDSADPTEKFYLMLNAADEPMTFVLPAGSWELALSAGEAKIESGVVQLQDFSMAVGQGLK
ncbi:MAG: hypothetical protein ACXWH0_13170, partial [Acidimicrobiia bacterium]